MIIDLLDRPRVRVSYQNREIRDVIGKHRKQIEANNWAVFNSASPIPGEVTWVSEPTPGMFYAAGPREKYTRQWQDREAWEVVEVTNQEVVLFFKRLVERKAGLIDWDEIQEMGIGYLAEKYHLPWKYDDNEAVSDHCVTQVRNPDETPTVHPIS